MCSSCNNPGHDPLNDSLDDIFGGEFNKSHDEYVEAAKGKADLAYVALTPKMHEEPCKDCRATGRFYSWAGRYLGPCRKCKGTGKRYFRQSLEQRDKAKARLAAKKAEKQQEVRNNADDWKANNPAAYAWLQASAGYSGFASSLLEALNKFGSLTEKQAAAVENILRKNAEAAAAKITREANAPELNVGPLYEAFERALNNGLKRPKMFLGSFKFSLAPATGNNAGCLYVVSHETGDYYGKITPAKKFVRVRSTTDEIENEIIRVCADPLAEAIAYGKQTGICSCCGRELENEESVELGIGPICRRKYF